MFRWESKRVNVLVFIISELAGEIQLKKYGLFFNEYATQLKAIESALDETAGESWDFTLDPIALQVVVLISAYHKAYNYEISKQERQAFL